MYRMFAGLLILAVLVGCEARSQVAMDKITKRIDKMLGELDVKRKQIDNQIKQLNSSLEEVRTKRISAKVKLEEYEGKVDGVNKQINELKKGLEIFRPYVDATEPVEINGRSYEPAQIVESVNLLADEYESLTKKLGGYENSLKAFERAHNLLQAQEAQGKQTMSDLNNKISEIDAKKEAIDAMKTAGGLAEESISDRFDKLVGEVDDLFIDVETAMRVEEEKLADAQRQLDSESNSVDEILSDLNTSADAKSRIDEILGGSGGDN